MNWSENWKTFELRIKLYEMVLTKEDENPELVQSVQSIPSALYSFQCYISLF